MCTAEIRGRRTGKTRGRASALQIRQPDLENNNAALITCPKADVASERKNSCSCSDLVGPELTPFTSSWSHIDKRLFCFFAVHCHIETGKFEVTKLKQRLQ